MADQVVKLRQESERLSANQLTEGMVLVSDRRHAAAASYKAQADFRLASLGYLLAWAELEQAVGRAPGLGWSSPNRSRSRNMTQLDKILGIIGACALAFCIRSGVYFALRGDHCGAVPEMN